MRAAIPWRPTPRRGRALSNRPTPHCASDDSDEESPANEMPLPRAAGAAKAKAIDGVSRGAERSPALSAARSPECEAFGARHRPTVINEPGQENENE